MQNQIQETIEKVPVFEARWFLICVVVVAPLWIWPIDFVNVFAAFGVSILKALGWVVGLALVVLLNSMALSAIGKALLKSSSQQPGASRTQSQQ